MYSEIEFVKYAGTERVSTSILQRSARMEKMVVSEAAQWPLSFSHNLAEQKPKNGKIFWSHKCYKGPQGQPVQILYSRTKADSEEIAQMFLNEPVVGFDMEWPWESDKRTRLQDKIGLIQVACEDKIALFHIGLHTGTTPKDLLAPSLRQLIEDPNISKAGVAVQNADFSRLKTWFDVQPRGAFELSHLHNLITYGGNDPSRCTAKLYSLANHVQTHLGYPLQKGKVRTSNWSKPLNQEQIAYAAADAYCGFMLYHCMNAKRVAMDPTPPLPLQADKYARLGKHSMGKNSMLLLRSPDGTASFITAKDFFVKRDVASEEPKADIDVDANYESESDIELENMVPKATETVPGVTTPTNAIIYPKSGRVLGAVTRHLINDKMQQGAVSEKATPEWVARSSTAAGDEDDEAGANTVVVTLVTATTSRRRGQKPRPKKDPVFLDATSQELFNKLRDQRKRLASEKSVAAFCIAHSSTLEDIAKKRPRNKTQLGQIQGIGKKKLDDYGDVWLAVINQSVMEEEKGEVEQSTGPSSLNDGRLNALASFMAPPEKQQHSTPVRYPTLKMTTIVTPDFRPPPQMHTGLSVQMERTRLTRGKFFDATEEDDSDDPQPGSAWLSPEMLKRKRPSQPSQMMPGRKMPRTVMTTSQHASQVTKPLDHMSPSSRIFKNKIVAFSKVVTARMEPKPPGPLVSDATLDMIVARPPRTIEELLQIPGVIDFANASARTNLNLLDRIIKFTPPCLARVEAV